MKGGGPFLKPPLAGVASADKKSETPLHWVTNEKRTEWEFRAPIPLSFDSACVELNPLCQHVPEG